MALFPVLESDGKVQLDEKIRLNGLDSFVSVGSNAITTMTVKPENSETPISIFTSDVSERYLDWMYTAFVGDFDSENNKIDFSESGQDPVVGVVTPGTYTVSQLATQVESAMNAVGGGTYTVSVDAKNRFKIESTVSFNMFPETGDNVSESILSIIGFKLDLGTGTSAQGTPMEAMPKNVTIEIGDGVGTASISKKVRAYSKDGDRLFSSDEDLKPLESKIIRWLPEDHSTFNYQHREAQEQIMNYLDRNGYVNVFDNKYTKFDFIDLEEVRDWSKWLALKLIYEDQSESVDDKFQELAKMALNKESESRQRAVLRLDTNNDGKQDTGEHLTIGSVTVFRR